MRVNNSPGASLILEASIFKKLHQELIERVASMHGTDASTISEYQLYGFYQYDEALPSVKLLVLQHTKIYINGKYLYTKWRNYVQGSQQIKLHREYVYVYFRCLGYAHINDYLRNSPHISEEDRLTQADLLLQPVAQEETKHYLGFYLGEHGVVIRTAFIFNLQRRFAEWHLYYWQGKKLEVLAYKGQIIDIQQNLSFFFSKDRAHTGKDVFLTLFYGNKNIHQKPLLKGIYSGFDVMEQAVAGIIVFQFMENRDSLFQQLNQPGEIPAPIAAYLQGKRFIIEHILPKDLQELA